MTQHLSKLSTLFVLTAISFGFFAQTNFTAFSPEIGTTTCPASNVNFLAGVYSDLPSGISFSGFTRSVVNCAAAGSHYRSSAYNSTSRANAISENRYVTWSFTSDATVFFNLNEVAIRHERSAAGADNGALFYSINGAPFEQVGIDFAIPEATNRTVFEFGTPVSISINSTIVFRWYCWRVATTGGGNVRYRGGSDYATASGISGTFTSTLPGITVNPSILTTFSQTLGSPSAEQSFEVSGANLTEDIVINVPLGYEISLTSGSGFASGLSLSPINESIATTTIYIRLNAIAEGDYNGVIEIGSNEISTVEIIANGTTSNQPPIVLVSPSSLSNFTQFLGTPSNEQNLLISGDYLTSDITITTPLGFELSLSSGSGFTNQVTLNQIAGVVAETTIYVRLNYNVVGTLIENITITTADSDDILVPISGSVESPIPPTLGVSPIQLNPFLQNLGFPSAPQILTVGGENLNGDITVVSTGNFFISTDISGPYTQSITLEPFAAYVGPTQIFVHLNASTVGIYNGEITITTSDLNPVVIPLSGETIQPAGTLIYYWHFNTLETPEDVTSIDANYSLVPDVIGKFDYTNPVEGQRDMDAYDAGSLLNAQLGEGAGKGVRVRNASLGRTLDFFVPTNLASGIKFSYAIERSASGMNENVFSYSIDGTNFTTNGLQNNVIALTTNYVIYEVDFSSIAEANDNPNFRIRISYNSAVANGNNRIDNITLVANNYVGINDETLPKVVVYPNPAEESIQILSEALIRKVYVLDLNGRIVMESTEYTVDINKLENGLYLMLIETDQGTVQRSFLKK